MSMWSGDFPAKMLVSAFILHVLVMLEPTWTSNGPSVQKTCSNAETVTPFGIAQPRGSSCWFISGGFQDWYCRKHSTFWFHVTFKFSFCTLHVHSLAACQAAPSDSFCLHSCLFSQIKLIAAPNGKGPICNCERCDWERWNGKGTVQRSLQVCRLWAQRSA